MRFLLRVLVSAAALAVANLLAVLPALHAARSRPADLLRGELEAAAALVFARALPGGVELAPGESRSYAQWLGQGLGAEAEAGA